jgi:fatty acid desaturase
MKLATRLPAERSLRPEDADRIASIREEIIAVGDAFRARHPRIVRHQDAIGLTLFVIGVVGVIGDAWLYIEGVIPWWVCIPLSAFWLSILHELEHDLIHWMYFRSRRWVHHVMMFGVWFLRPSTINPWIRRSWHLHHHEVAGTESDIEERTITNGERWNGFRLLSLMDGILGVYAQPFRFRKLANAYVAKMNSDRPRRLKVVTYSVVWPLGGVHYGLWHLFLGLHAFELLGGHLAHTGAYHALNVFAVVLLAPNALRQFCLHFVSSNMHYHGDVEEYNIFKQTQVWTARRMWPVQAFCFNFGGTHAIHHFVIRDPFYIRQAMAKDCLAVLRRHGVRFNDFGTFRRANRWTLTAEPES